MQCRLQSWRLCAHYIGLEQPQQNTAQMYAQHEVYWPPRMFVDFILCLVYYEQKWGAKDVGAVESREHLGVAQSLTGGATQVLVQVSTFQGSTLVPFF